MSPRLEGLLLPSIADVSVLSLDVSHEAIRIDLCSTAGGGMPGLRERVDPGAQLLPAVSCGRTEWRTEVPPRCGER
ncbi:hypothetical protein GCM10023336_37180 [Streptomyces similanensis]|uniref:Uncharacterized protein n=1 Tax=Streptomyces similanensis TaxID=1274988 RepID=A0ABP9KPV5_9ACTN